MKTLLLARHAKSSWKTEGIDDHERPLNKRGKQDAPRLGQWLKDNGLKPQLILSSTAERAKTTARAVAAVLDNTEVRTEAVLYSGDHAEYINTLRALPPSITCVMVVGHNPDMEALVHQLTGADEVMPTAALAEIHVPIDAWSELKTRSAGQLLRVWRPKEE